jgi:hypothetical protein
MPESSKWSLFLRFPHKKPVYMSPLPHMCYIPRPSLLDLITPLVFGEVYRLLQFGEVYRLLQFGEVYRLLQFGEVYRLLQFSLCCFPHSPLPHPS